MYTKKRGILAGVVGGLLLSFAAGAAPQMRYWYTQDEARFLGEYEKEMIGKYFFRGTDGRLFSVAKTNLTASGVDYINALRPAKVKIKFSKRAHELSDYPTEYDPDTHDDLEVEITGIVEVRKVSKAPYTGTLYGEVYMIGKELATEDYRLFAQKAFKVSFPGSEKVYSTSLSKTLMTWDPGNGNKRGAEYAGYVVVIREANGNLIAFDTNLYWMGEEKIDALRKLPCPAFLNEACQKRPVPRPQNKDDRTIDPKNY